MIGFTGNSLLPLEGSKDLPNLPSNKSLPPTPGFPHDATSQVLTIDRLGTSTPAQSTAALSSDSALRDMQALLGAYYRGETRWQAGRDELLAPAFGDPDEPPRASSTLMGVYACQMEETSSARTLVQEPYDGEPRAAEFDRRWEDDPYDERFEDSGYSSPCDSHHACEDFEPLDPYERPAVDSFFVYDEYPFISANEVRQIRFLVIGDLLIRTI